MRIRRIVVLACALAAGNLLAAGTALAAPKKRAPRPAAPAATPEKDDARALMQSGLKLYAAKDFLGALAVFRNAYERFASARILLNIGTTLTRLDRKAEAANVYQRYLDSSDSDPAKQDEVRRVLAELDAAVVTLELSVSPGDAEIQVNDEDWVAAGTLARHRVAAGPLTVRARHPAYQPGEHSARALAGTTVPITLALAEIPPPPAPTPVAVVESGLRAGATLEPRRAQIGAIALAHVDIANGGGAGLVGVTVDITDRLQAQAAAILGPSYGGYAGASFAVVERRLRPLVSAGIPIFVSSGARIAVRGAGGVELAVNRHLAVIAELGVEYLFNPEPDVKRTLFIPAIGAAGRL